VPIFSFLNAFDSMVSHFQLNTVSISEHIYKCFMDSTHGKIKLIVRETRECNIIFHEIASEHYN